MENAAKTIIAQFGISPKTHEPELHISKLIKSGQIPQKVLPDVLEMLPDLLTLGKEEHFMTDYTEMNCRVFYLGICTPKIQQNLL